LNERELRCPEGLNLKITLPPLGDRLNAFIFDLLVILLIDLIIIELPLTLFQSENITHTLYTFGVFLTHNLYFIYFELAWQGRTPGKKFKKLQVINKKGFELSPFAIVVRNLTRQVELMVPLLLFANLEGWSIFFSTVFPILWFFLITLHPVFNKDRLRLGDILAGTIVVLAPQKILLPDLSDSPEAQKRKFYFTKNHLSIYGNFELLTLEEILRKPILKVHYSVFSKVALNIAKKINYPLETPYDQKQEAQYYHEFLTDFYTAERAFLEEARLYGLDKSDKNSPMAAGPPKVAPVSRPLTPSERFRLNKPPK
jgi:uncharacterized RDD family membrane protein YckC